MKMAGLFEVYHDDGVHHWVLRDWDGQITARNGGYLSRTGALQDIERLRVIALTANVVEVGSADPRSITDDRDRRGE